MKITLIDAGKRFNRDWIFRHLNYEFQPGHTYAITGPNGSGKSTLLQSIAGAMAISEGSIRYETNASSPQTHPPDRRHPSDLGARPASSPLPSAPVQLPPEQAYQHLSLAAPYLQLVEEMTVTEFLHFHAAFKPLLPGISAAGIIRKVGLETATHKQMRYYSSGMKQRVRLAQAIFSDSTLVLLDEPCTNLDTEGIGLYRELIAQYTPGRLVIVSSNDIQEYEFCEKRIDIRNYR
jgi:ABC-type multidrug transport system ATPase subunit